MDAAQAGARAGAGAGAGARAGAGAARVIAIACCREEDVTFRYSVACGGVRACVRKFRHYHSLEHLQPLPPPPPSRMPNPPLAPKF